MNAVVVGAGLGGLTVAVRLLAAGHRVTVLEARPEPGGRASRIVEGGYRFDTGPSLITMPEVIEEVFAAAGTTTARELELVPLDPFYRIHWRGEEQRFRFEGDAAAMREQVAAFSPADAARFDAFLAASRRIYEEAILVAGRQPFLRVRDFAALVPAMARLGALRSVDGFVGRFFREPHVRQAFGFHPLFIGGDPYRVPAVYAALAYLQLDGGVWYARGGVWSLVEALARLVRAGGELRCGDPVTAIETAGGRVRAVRTAAGERIEADIVVSNADPTLTATRLLGRPAPRPRQTMSCYLLYLGTDRPFPQLDHHTLLVGRDYAGFIADVTRRGRLSADVSLYVHAPARTEPAMAPGGESIAVLLPVTNLDSGYDWAAAEPRVREWVLDALEGADGLGLHGLRRSIRVERAWTPLTFRDDLGAPGGAAFGPEPLLRQSAYFRQPNRDRRVGGLYYVGAGTHPGAGIPGVMLTALVTAALIGSDHAASRPAREAA